MSGARIELHSLGPARPWVGQLVPIDVSVWRAFATVAGGEALGGGS